MEQKLNLKEALYKRQSTRAFDMSGLSADELKQITDYAASLEPLIPGMQAKADIVGPDEIKAIMKWRAPHYFAIYSDGSDEGIMNAAYIYEQVVIYMTSLGIGTCWATSVSPKDKDEAERLRAQRESDAKRAREFREQMERAKENARTRGETEARRIIREARAQADAIFEELNQLRKEQERAANWQNVNDARAAIRAKLNQVEDDLRFIEEKEPIPAPSRPIQVGDLVELGGTRTKATVTAVSGDKLQLAAGNMKLTVKASEVRLIEEVEKQQEKKPTRHVTTNLRSSGGRAASTEVDIRGMMTDEAEVVVDQFIDHAAMNKLGSVTIIHGKGTGALRKAVQLQLKHHPLVRSFRLGRYGEGEDGVTVVELK